MHSLSATHAPHVGVIPRGVNVHVFVAGSQLVPLHGVSSITLHCTQVPAAHTPRSPGTLEHWPLSSQGTQLPASQRAAPASVQSPSPRHATQRFMVVSQNAVLPVHALESASVHWTHVPLASSQTGIPLGHAIPHGPASGPASGGPASPPSGNGPASGPASGGALQSQVGSAQDPAFHSLASHHGRERSRWQSEQQTGSSGLVWQTPSVVQPEARAEALISSAASLGVIVPQVI
jgi:hypothetical protein